MSVELFAGKRNNMNERQYRTARGQDGYICEECGCVVMDKTTHDAWHAKLYDPQRTASAMNESGPTASIHVVWPEFVDDATRRRVTRLVLDELVEAFPNQAWAIQYERRAV